MERPLRTTINISNLIRMGVPKEFIYKSMNDFHDFGSKNLKALKNFIIDYINNFSDNIRYNRGLFLYGSNGVGKSFIASNLVKEAYIRRYTARRVTFSDYIAHYTDSWGATNPETRELYIGEFYQYYKGVDVLVIEEIGKELDTKLATTLLEDCLRYREEKGKLTIICTNLNPTMIKEKYGNSIASLIQGNMTPIKIVADDKRQLVYKDK